MTQLRWLKYRHFTILTLPLLMFLAFLFALEASAQVTDKSALRQLWYNNKGTEADTACLSAGIRLIKLYKKPPGNPDSVRIICMDMDARGIQNGNRRWRANAWNELGDYLLSASQVDSALNAFQQALKFSSDEDIERIRIYGNMGKLLSMQNENDSAVTYFNKGIELVKKYNHGQNLLPKLYGNMSISMVNQGNYLEAIQYEQEAIKYGNDRDQTISYYNIGIVFKQLYLSEEARFNFQQSIYHAQKENLPHLQLIGYAALIELAASTSEVDSLLQLGNLILKEQPQPVNELHLVSAAATRYITLKAFDSAKPLIDRCLNLAASQKNDTHRLILQYLQAWLRYNDGKYKASLDICAAIEKDVEALGQVNKRDLYDLMSSDYEALGQIDKALLYARKKDLAQQEISDNKFLKSLVGTYFKNRAEQEKSLMQLEMDTAAKHAEAVRKRQNLIISFVGTISFMLLVLVLMIYYFYKQKTSAARHLQHLNERLQTEQQNLHRKNEKLKRFSSIVSHDILSNLDLILSAGHVLVTPSAPKQNIQKYVEMTQSTSVQLKEYCLGLLEEAKRDMTPPEHTQLTDPMPLVWQLLSNWQTSLAPLNLQVHLNPLMPTLLPPAIVEQLFQNLISNVARYAAHVENPAIKVSEGRSETGDKIWIVEDNGPGIPEYLKNEIFAPRNGAQSESKGQGIGLSLLKSVLREYNADIQVENADGGGARFVITLPSDPNAD